MSLIIFLIITLVVYWIYIHVLKKPNTEDELYMEEILDSKYQLLTKLEEEMTTSEGLLSQKQQLYQQLENEIEALAEKQQALEEQLESLEKERLEILNITVTEQEAVEFYHLEQTSQ